MDLLRTYVLASAFLVAPGESVPQSKRVSVGQQVPDFDLGRVIRGDGRHKLSELAGLPILLVGCASKQMDIEPQAAKLAEEFEVDELIVVMFDPLDEPAESVEAFAWKALADSRVWFVPRRFMPIEFTDREWPPLVALIAPDGELILASSIWTDAGPMVKRVEEQVERLKKGWGDDPEARKARATAFGSLKLGKAWTGAHAELSKELPNPDLSQAVSEIEARYRGWLSSVLYLLEDGQPLRAQERARALLEAVDGQDEWEQQVTDLLEKIKEAGSELQLDKKLERLLDKIRRRGPSRGMDRKFLAIAEAAGATSRVAARAKRLAEVFRYIDEEL